MFAGDGGAGGNQVSRRAFEDDMAGGGAEVDDPVGVRLTA